MDWYIGLFTGEVFENRIVGIIIGLWITDIILAFAAGILIQIFEILGKIFFRKKEFKYGEQVEFVITFLLNFPIAWIFVLIYKTWNKHDLEERCIKNKRMKKLKETLPAQSYSQLREAKLARRKRNFNIALALIAIVMFSLMAITDSESRYWGAIFLSGMGLAFIVYIISEMKTF